MTIRMKRADIFTTERSELTFPSLLEDAVLIGSETLQDELCTVHLDSSVIGDIATHPLKLPLPYPEQGIDGSFSDFQTRQVGQEIVSDKEDEENPVIDGPFELERYYRRSQVELDS